MFSPERVLTGRVFEDLKKYPKLIGGLSEAGAALARDFYSAVLDFDYRDDLGKPNGVWDLGSAEAAEMAKLAETTYRDVNIALANQFARAEEVGVDIYKVIEACNSQPYSHIHRPGISVGGHCKPVYPRLYLSTDPTGGVVRAARSLNAMMPLEVLRQIEREIGPLQNKKVTLLGVTYRPGVKETAFSGAHVLAQELLSRGASVSALDPLLSNAELTAAGFEASNDYSETEIIILHTAQSEFAMLQPSDFPSLKLVFDGRNFLKESIWAGVAVVSLGRP